MIPYQWKWKNVKPVNFCMEYQYLVNLMVSSAFVTVEESESVHCHPYLHTRTSTTSFVFVIFNFIDFQPPAPRVIHYHMIIYIFINIYTIYNMIILITVEVEKFNTGANFNTCLTTKEINRYILKNPHPKQYTSLSS